MRSAVPELGGRFSHGICPHLDLGLSSVQGRGEKIPAAEAALCGGGTAAAGAQQPQSQNSASPSARVPCALCLPFRFRSLVVCRLVRAGDLKSSHAQHSCNSASRVTQLLASGSPPCDGTEATESFPVTIG